MNRILYLHGFASSPASSKARFFRERLTRAGEPVTLVGSSMGGYLAALYAARGPETARVVLMAPAFGFARRWRERLGAAAVEEWKRTGALEVFHYGEGRTCKL